MTPTDREQLEDDVKLAEGLRLKAYQDSVGVWTIGFGTNLQELKVDETLATVWLRDKLTEAEHECQTAFPWWCDLDSVRQRAVTELVYNLGLTRFRMFVRTIEALANQDYERAAQQLQASKWAKQVGPTRSGRLIGMIRTGA